VLGAGLLAAVSGYHLWTVQSDLRTTEVIVAEYLFVSAIAVLGTAGLSTVWASISTAEVPGRLLDAIAAVALAGSIWLLGMRQFGGYDHSAMIQAGWVQLSALVPFQDHPCTFPPLFFLGCKYALLLFGVRWSAFVFLMAVFAASSYLFLSRQLRALGFPALGATTLAVATEVGTCVVCSFWWHNPVASVVVVMVFLSALVCLARADDWASWIFLGISSALLVLGKPNAWPIAGCIALLWFSREAGRRTRALVFPGLAVALAGVVCWLNRLAPLRVLRTWAELAETRGNPLSMIGLEDLAPVERDILIWLVGAVVLLFVVVLVDGRGELSRYWREYACCAATAFTSLAMASMNYEIKTSDLTPLVVALAVAAFRPWSSRRLDGIARRATVLVTVFLVALSSYWGVTRLRVRGIGERAFFESVPLQTIQTGFFAGLRSGPRLIAVLHQVGAVLDTYPSTKVFFGPRMEFSYAAFRRDPPRGLPIWWHPGSSYPASDAVAVSRTLESADFDLLIFLKGDYTRMPRRALLHRLRSYDRVSGFGELDVYLRRKRV
jgi:hypothetical protein